MGSSVPFLLSIILILVTPLWLCAGDPVVLAPGTGSVVIYGGAVSADHFYTIDGDLRRFDTNGTGFSAVTFGLTLRYGIIDGMELNGELPISSLSVTSLMRFPDRSIFAPAYLGLGGTVRLLESPLNASADLMLKIPPGFHRGIYDDPEHPSFLSDGFFQVSAGLNLGAWLDPVWLKGRLAYNWRDEEPVDEALYAIQIGVTRVEGTGIHVGVDGVIPLDDVARPARPFYAGASGSPEQLGQIDGGTGRFATIDRESYLALAAGAYVDITSAVTLSGNYTIRLFGQNSLALAGAFLGIGYAF